jgi:hypothetical protein
VLLDQVQDAFLHGRPDRRRMPRPGRRIVQVVIGHLVEPGHVLDRHLDLDLDRFRARRLNDLDVVRPAQEPGGLVDRAHGRGQPDPLRGLGQQPVQPLQ